MFYSLEIIKGASDLRESGQTYETLKDARKWAKFYSTMSTVTSVRVMQGGFGGVEHEVWQNGSKA